MPDLDGSADSMDRTFLAIDYGRRRVGLAKSDPTGLIATALTTLEITSTRQAVQKLAGLIKEHQPAAVVIGYPLLASGDPSEACREVDAFVEKLKTVYDGPIHKVDEYGTSEEAADIIHVHGKRIGKDRKRVDRLAAVIILQRFLDETSGH
jgi:putative Holliday junction resolvase